MQTRPSIANSIQVVARLSDDVVDALRDRLETIKPFLREDKSNYAPGRENVWVGCEWDLKNKQFKPAGFWDEELWKFCQRIYPGCQMVLLTYSGDGNQTEKGKGIGYHRDDSYAAFPARNLTIEKSNDSATTWGMKQQHPGMDFVPKDQQNQNLPEYIFSIPSGTVTEFNCKNPHAAAPNQERWSINLWKVSKKYEKAYEQHIKEFGLSGNSKAHNPSGQDLILPDAIPIIKSEGDRLILPCPPIHYNWAKQTTTGQGYEVSSAGDRRFSALYAQLSDGRTIEEAYQLDVKGYRNHPEIQEQLGAEVKFQALFSNQKFRNIFKGQPPLTSITREQSEQQYKELWRTWANENPALMEELAENARASGGVLTDKFATTQISQARALSELLNEQLESGRNHSLDALITTRQGSQRDGEGKFYGFTGIDPELGAEKIYTGRKFSRFELEASPLANNAYRVTKHTQQEHAKAVGAYRRQFELEMKRGSESPVFQEVDRIADKLLEGKKVILTCYCPDHLPCHARDVLQPAIAQRAQEKQQQSSHTPQGNYSHIKQGTEIMKPVQQELNLPTQETPSSELIANNSQEATAANAKPVKLSGKPIEMSPPMSANIYAMRTSKPFHTTRTYCPSEVHGFHKGDVAIAVSGSIQIAFKVLEEYPIDQQMMNDPGYQKQWAQMERRPAEKLRSYAGKAVYGLVMEPLGEYKEGEIIPFSERSAATPAKADTPFRFAETVIPGTGYDISSRGDDQRFNPMEAMIPDTRKPGSMISIEEAYQLRVKGYERHEAIQDERESGSSFADIMNDRELRGAFLGEPAINGKTPQQCWQEYKKLWKTWAEQPGNKELLADLAEKAKGKILTDSVAGHRACPARALTALLKQQQQEQEGQDKSDSKQLVS
jgi:hypothetical protein